MPSNYEIQQWKPGVYRIKDIRVYATLFVGERHALLYDTTYGYEDIASVVKSITSLPLIVIVGHFHIDHSGGYPQFPCIYAHPNTLRQLSQSDNNRRRELSHAYLNTLSSYPVPSGNIQQPERPVALRPLTSGMEFDLGGLRLQTHYFPGHTDGDLALYCPEYELLLAGDTVDSVIWMYFDHSLTQSQYLHSLREIRALFPKYIFTSHSKNPKDLEFLDALIDVLATIDSSKSIIAPPATLPREYQDTKPWRYETKRLVHQKPYSFVVVYRDDKLQTPEVPQ